MVDQPLDAPVSRREFYQGMTTVWLFIVLTSLPAGGARWTALILPVGALGILLLYARTLRRRPAAT